MLENWDKYAAEWFEQARYDLDTGEFLFEGGRYIYAVFMCHLALEKALKGKLVLRKQTIPPKSHNLVYLLKNTGINIDVTDKNYLFLIKINEWCIPTRYPDKLSDIKSMFDKRRVSDILKNTKGVLEWLISGK